MSAGPRVRMTPKDIAQQASSAIVRIEVTDKHNGDRIGTGFILDKAGLIATNLHVVAGTTDISVKLHDGTPYKVLQVAGVDAGRDLAVLRIKPTKPLPTVRLGDSAALTAGDQVTAIGNPLGVFDYSVTAGLISQVRAICRSPAPASAASSAGGALEHKQTDGLGEAPVEEGCPPGGLTLLQISTPISQGSSGGPLFNQFGEVVGVTTLIIAAGQSINFAVPGNYLKPLVARPIAMALDTFAAQTQLAEHENGSGNEPRGEIVRRVPDHSIKVLEGCSDADVDRVVKAISDAIDVGAPLYNRGDIEACFRIYEGTSSKLERDPPCIGVGRAFGDGLLRASTLESYKEKAWALRDTFDGLIKVAMKRRNGPPQPPQPLTPSDPGDPHQADSKRKGRDPVMPRPSEPVQPKAKDGKTDAPPRKP